MAALPLVVLILLEGILRMARYGGDLRLFVDAKAPYEQYYRVNPKVGKRIFFRQSTLPLPSNDVFLKNKTGDVFRIFVMGGSTALGFPYGNILMFSRILQHRLQDTFPGRRIEMVNTALTAVNTYTLLDFMQEILDKEPDGILIYAGHNEYYGALGVGSFESPGHSWLVRAYLRLRRFRIVPAMRDILAKAARIRGRLTNGAEVNPFGTLMERLAAKRIIPLGSSLFTEGERQFERNLRSMLRMARKAGVPVMISELVSNTAGQAPFVSLKSGPWPGADSVFSRALSMAACGRYREADSLFEWARDLDCLRFRAPESFNRIIHGIAADFHVPVIPMKAAFREAASHGLIGDSLMTDHLHPNREGAFLMADAFYRSMKKNRWIGDGWDRVPAVPADIVQRYWPMTRLDSTVASLMISQLKSGWPFRPAGTENRYLTDFKPQNEIEALALEVLFQRMTPEQAHFVLAGRHESLGDVTSANREYDAITRLVFIEAYAYLDRARAFLRASLPDSALALLEKSLALEKIPLALRLAGSILVRQGRYQEAVPVLEEAREKIPAHPDLLRDLMLAYRNTGNKTGARDCERTLGLLDR
ncbi:tetratricopeptide repeat protein [bacterium]|nr:tetratricopeptide repeat protein [bacterium]